MKIPSKLKNFAIINNDEMKQIFGGDNTILRLSDKERACQGKSLCASCSWIANSGQLIYGKCSQNAFTPNRYCSDLNCHY